MCQPSSTCKPNEKGICGHEKDCSTFYRFFNQASRLRVCPFCNISLVQGEVVVDEKHIGGLVHAPLNGQEGTSCGRIFFDPKQLVPWK